MNQKTLISRSRLEWGNERGTWKIGRCGFQAKSPLKTNDFQLGGTWRSQIIVNFQMQTFWSVCMEVIDKELVWFTVVLGNYYGWYSSDQNQNDI